MIKNVYPNGVVEYILVEPELEKKKRANRKAKPQKTILSPREESTLKQLDEIPSVLDHDI